MRTITYHLSLVMIFVIPWQNIVNIEGLGTISRAVGLLVAVFWVLLVVSTNRFRRPLPFHVAVFLFVFWNALSIFWSVNTDSTLQRFGTYLQLGVMVFILWDLFTTPAALRAGFQAYILGAYVSIGSLIVNYQAGVEDSFQRFSATGFNSNDVAMILALGMPVAWHLAVSEESGNKAWLPRLINFAYIPAALLAILLTSSRAGFFATVPTLFFMIASFTSLKIYVRVLLLVALIGSLFALQPLVPESSLQRLASTGTAITQDDSKRWRIWREGIEIFSEHPILGVGSGNRTFLTVATETRGASHNFVLGLLAQLGIIGFGLFVTILAITVYYCRVLPKAHSRLWLTILMAWLIGAATHNLEHNKYTWLFLSLAVADASLFVRRRETRPITVFPLDSSEITQSKRS